MSVRSRAVPAREAIAAYRDKLSPADRAEYDSALERGRREMWDAIEAQEAADLAALRKAVKLSQATVAERRGVSQPSVAKMERQAPGTIQLGTLHQHVQALGMALDLVATAPDGRTFRIPLSDGAPDETGVAAQG